MWKPAAGASFAPARTNCSYIAALSANADIENSVDVEKDQEAPLEAVHAGRDACKLRIEVHRIVLATIGRKLQHLADRIDQQPVGFAFALDPDRHPRATVLERGQAQALAHIDGGHDATGAFTAADFLTIVGLLNSDEMTTFWISRWSGTTNRMGVISSSNRPRRLRAPVLYSIASSENWSAESP